MYFAVKGLVNAKFDPRVRECQHELATTIANAGQYVIGNLPTWRDTFGKRIDILTVRVVKIMDSSGQIGAYKS